MAIGKAIGEFVEGLEHTVMFFISTALFLFAAGSWYGMYYATTKMFMWPTYLLAVALVVYIIVQLEK